MEFIGLKIAGFVLWTAFSWYVGKRWAEFNSISDVAARFNEAKTAVSAELTKLQKVADDAKAKAEALKQLVP